MRIAAISDIHGNLPALDAVLEDIGASGADLVINLGDILSGPLWIEETADRLMALGLPTIRGNHERQVLTLPAERMGSSDAFAAQRITPAQRAWLLAMPTTIRPAPQVYCCHGTPDDDLQYLLETAVGGWVRGGSPGIRAANVDEVRARLGDAMEGVPHALILCGHSHVPRTLALPDGRMVVNPGSVGLQAYDDDHGQPHVVENGSPHARYALVTLRATGWQVECRAVPYDHEAAARRAEENGRPDWADALRTGRVGRLESEIG